MNNASDFLRTEDVSPFGAGISLVALMTFDLIGNSALILLLFLHLRKAKERVLNPVTTFQLLLYFAITEFAYSMTVEGLSVACYLSSSFDLTMSRGLCLFQAWASLTLTVSANWTMTLLAVERLLSGTKPVSLQRQKRRRDRFLYTCYTGFIISALVAVVPVTREGSVRTFDPSSSFCHFNYSASDDAIMTSFCICITVLTFILFQVQLYSFVSLLCEERRTNKAVKNARKFDYEEQNTSTNQDLVIYHEYWLYRRKVRGTFAGKHKWNLTVTVLSLIGWLWICLLLFMVTLVKSQSGGEVSPRTSFAAVRMLSIHNSVNPFLVIFIFAPFRQRALHFITCGRIEYSRDDFILSKYLDHDVTKNSEPNWWRVIESSQWDEHTPNSKREDGTYVYENDVNDEVDSYYESEYGSYASRNNEDFKSGHSVQPSVPSSVYYLNEEGKADVSNDYLLAVPVNKPGTGSGEIVERIFILHESQKDGYHSNGSDKPSPELLIGEDVSHSPKLKQVVQSPKFQEMLKRNRRDPEDISPRLFKVVPSHSSSLHNGGATELYNGGATERPGDQLVVTGGIKTTSFVESVQMTPRLKGIVESPAFQETALRSDSFVIDSESSSSSPEHVRRTGPTHIPRTEKDDLTSTPKLKRVMQSQNLRKCVLQRQESTGTPKFSKPSKKSHLITVVESRSKEDGTVTRTTNSKKSVTRTNSKKSVLSHNDVELIQLSDESATSVDRQINTPERRKRENKSQGNDLERITRRNVGSKYRHNMPPKETALLQDVGTKPLQVLGLSPKYNKNKHEENGLFSKGDDRPEILNALFQKALLIGSSTNIIDEDELVKTAGSGNESLANGSFKNPRDVSIAARHNSDHDWATDLDGKEILIDGNYASDLTPEKKTKQNDNYSVRTGRVTFQLDPNQQEKYDKVNRGVTETSKGMGNSPSIEEAALSVINEDDTPLEIDEQILKVQFCKDQEHCEYKERKIPDQARGGSDENLVEENILNVNHDNDERRIALRNLNKYKASHEGVPLDKAHFAVAEVVLEAKREDGNNCWKHDGVGKGYMDDELGDRDINRNKGMGNGTGSQVTIPSIVVVGENESTDTLQLEKGGEHIHNNLKTMGEGSNDNEEIIQEGEGSNDNEDDDSIHGGDMERTIEPALNGKGMHSGKVIPAHKVAASTGNGFENSCTVNRQNHRGQHLPNHVSSKRYDDCLDNSPTRHQVDVFVESVLKNILIENGEIIQ